MSDFSIPSPVPLEDNAPYWIGADNDQLMLKRCADCGRAHHYPRARCPFCFSDRTEWFEAAGTGTILSWTIMRRAKPNYALVYVTLDEGPSMLSGIVESDPESLHIGDRVEAVFLPSDDGPKVPMFRKPGEETKT